MNGQIPNSRRTRNGRIRQVMRKVEGNVAFSLDLGDRLWRIGIGRLVKPHVAITELQERQAVPLFGCKRLIDTCEGGCGTLTRCAARTSRC